MQAPKVPAPDADIVAQLSSAGFSENACKRAAVAVNNSGAEGAMNWLLSHMDDDDINDPLPAPAPVPGTSKVHTSFLFGA